MYLAPTSSVSVDQSVAERGRVAAHDARVLREHLKATWKRGRRLQELADLGASDSSESDGGSGSNSSSSSSSSSSDDDGDAMEQQIQSVRKRRRILDLLMVRHALSYNMACRPNRIDGTLPKLTSPLTELSEYDLREWTRFGKAEFRDMLTQLRLLPRKIRTPEGCACSLELALFIMLRRWTCGDRWEDVEKSINHHRSRLIRIYGQIRNDIMSAYRCVVKELDIARWEPKMAEWDDSLVESSRRRRPSGNVVTVTPGELLWIDGKRSPSMLHRIAAASGHIRLCLVVSHCIWQLSFAASHSSCIR
jgi:hypothetical protein